MERIGLALGGGGAKGVSHLLILEALEEMGLKPAYITGTSIGGLVGALVASGLDSKQITGVFRQMRFGQMYAMPWPIRYASCVNSGL